MPNIKDAQEPTGSVTPQHINEKPARVRAFVICTIVAGLTLAALLFFALPSVLNWRARSSLAHAEAYIAEQNWVAAKGQLAAYLSRFPDDLDALAIYANASKQILSERRRNWQDAGVAYFQIARNKQSGEDAQERLLAHFRDVGYWDDLDYYSSLLAMSRPGQRSLMYNQALAREHLGRENEAIEAYQTLIKAFPDDAQAYGRAAALLVKQGREGAASEMIQALRAAPLREDECTLPEARWQLACQAYGTAEQLATTALKKTGASEETLTLLATIAEEQQHWPAALDYWQRAWEQAPERGDILLGYASALRNAGDSEKARALLAGVPMQVLISSPYLIIAYAELLIESGDINDVNVLRGVYERAYPDHIIGRQYIDARVSIYNKDFAAAIPLLGSVVRESPSWSAGRYYLALACAGAKDWARARDEFLALRTIDPAALDLRARSLLAECEWQCGARKEAMDGLEQILLSGRINRSLLERYVLYARGSEQVARALPVLATLASAELPDDWAKLLKVAHARLSLDTGHIDPDGAASIEAEWKNNPDRADDLGDWVRAMTLTGRTDEAEKLLLGLADSKDIAHGDILFLLGEFNYRWRNPPRPNMAVGFYLDTLKEMPGHVDAMMALSELWMRSDNLREAYVATERVLALQPDNTAMLYRKATIGCELAHYEDALAALNRAMAVEPRPKGNWLRGRILLRMERFEEALADLQYADNALLEPLPGLKLDLAEAYRAVGESALADRFAHDSLNLYKSSNEAIPERLTRIVSANQKDI